MRITITPRTGAFIQALEDKLDRLKDDFKEWENFFCNTPGNLKSADRERARFEKEFNQVREELRQARLTTKGNRA